MKTEKFALSVVVPVMNEEDNALPLIEEIHTALEGVLDFEVIYVDDGSSDSTPQKLKEACEKYPNLRVFRHKKSCGQSQAIATGVKKASAPLIATLDGDGQNVPADIPKLLEMLEKQVDKEKVMIAGHRHKRKDTWLKRISSKLANGIRQRLLKDNTPDTGCGIKLFPREAFLDFPRFDHMHRYFPALMIRAGGKVISVHVDHRMRERGTSKYGFWDRLLVGIFDLVGVMWLIRRSSIPEFDNEEK